VIKKLLDSLVKAINTVSPVDAELKKACDNLREAQAKQDYLVDTTLWTQSGTSAKGKSK